MVWYGMVWVYVRVAKDVDVLKQKYTTNKQTNTQVARQTSQNDLVTSFMALGQFLGLF